MKRFTLLERTVCLLLLIILCGGGFAIVSCGDDDDDDETGAMCDPFEQDACEYIVDGHCTEDYAFGFESVPDCQDNFIQPLLDSNDPCEQAAGECLNTMEKWGPEEEGSDYCTQLEPTSCENAWQLWNECMALTEQEDC